MKQQPTPVTRTPAKPLKTTIQRSSNPKRVVRRNDPSNPKIIRSQKLTNPHKMASLSGKVLNSNHRVVYKDSVQNSIKPVQVVYPNTATRKVPNYSGISANNQNHNQGVSSSNQQVKKANIGNQVSNVDQRFADNQVNKPQINNGRVKHSEVENSQLTFGRSFQPQNLVSQQLLNEISNQDFNSTGYDNLNDPHHPHQEPQPEFTNRDQIQAPKNVPVILQNTLPIKPRANLIKQSFVRKTDNLDESLQNLKNQFFTMDTPSSMARNLEDFGEGADDNIYIYGNTRNERNSLQKGNRRNFSNPQQRRMNRMVESQIRQNIPDFKYEYQDPNVLVYDSSTQFQDEKGNLMQRESQQMKRNQEEMYMKEKALKQEMEGQFEFEDNQEEYPNHYAKNEGQDMYQNPYNANLSKNQLIDYEDMYNQTQSALYRNNRMGQFSREKNQIFKRSSKKPNSFRPRSNNIHLKISRLDQSPSLPTVNSFGEHQRRNPGKGMFNPKGSTLGQKLKNERKRPRSNMNLFNAAGGSAKCRFKMLYRVFLAS